jgi:alpha-galactosidase
MKKPHNLLGAFALVASTFFTSAIAESKPLKVFILAGQSNMQGHAHVSTFDSMASDPKTSSILKEMRGADGSPRVCQKVWISSVGCLGDGYSDVSEQKGILTAGFGASTEKIGPEFTFGITMEKALNEPILIIKTSWGGRDLSSDFRPPSAEPYVASKKSIDWAKQHNEDVNALHERVAKTPRGVTYRQMMDHVRMVLGDIKRVVPEYDQSQGYELAGFVWFQGFNDYINEWYYDDRDQPGGYAMYSKLLTLFIRDVREDLKAPKMPFVIGVMGIDGMKPGLHMTHFRQAMAAPASLPEFKGNVVALETAPFWDDDLASLQARAEKNEKLTPEEEKRLKAGVSNGGYHYLGAAKIIAPIGKAFAEAMVQLQTTNSQTKP